MSNSRFIIKVYNYKNRKIVDISLSQVITDYLIKNKKLNLGQHFTYSVFEYETFRTRTDIARQKV